MERDKTIRATPNYRGTGPWYDWVLVRYQVGNDEIALYPFQTHGFFVNDRKETLETVHESIFTIMIPRSCHLESEKIARDQVLVIKDRIGDWPSIFNNCNYEYKDVARDA
mmetsp:Transcript_89701/g.175548  ORF Transcript_89701/g.175548 Transcript_89701/m.175548 type:complete len:110 (-) Transcript_89701:3-332(-)